MKTLAIILARGGSKGLPRKNLLPLAGKPVVEWTIDHAQATPGLDRIVVSTDSEEIAHLARQRAVQVIGRPPHLAADHSSVDSAARFTVEAVEAVEASETAPATGRERGYDQIVILYGNVPVRPPDLSARGLGKLEQSGADSVQSLTAVGKHHPYWMKTLAGENQDTLEPFVENPIDRRQDLPPVYELDGGIIAVTRQSLFTVNPAHPHAFLGQDRRAILCEPGDVIDIDHQTDLHLAEAVLRSGFLARGSAGGSRCRGRPIE